MIDCFPSIKFYNSLWSYQPKICFLRDVEIRSVTNNKKKNRAKEEMMAATLVS